MILKKLQQYQDNIIYGLDYLFNELSEEDYHEPKEIRSVFVGSYILYESKGNKLALWEYFNKIRPYLRDMIDNHKAKGEWKIQLVMRIILLGTHRHASSILVLNCLRNYLKSFCYACIGMPHHK